MSTRERLGEVRPHITIEPESPECGCTVDDEIRDCDGSCDDYLCDVGGVQTCSECGCTHGKADDLP
jgi:hypothetical protein